MAPPDAQAMAPPDAHGNALDSNEVAHSKQRTDDVGPAEDGAVKLKKAGKIFLDNCPVVIGICFSFAKGSFAVFLLCWFTVSIAVLALVVDFFHCRHRQAAGLQAVFPKMIPVTFLVMNAVVLILLYAGVLKASVVMVINGCFVSGGLFLASAFSLLIKKPWIYAIALEAMTPARLQEVTSTPQHMQVFTEIMNAITWLWTGVFLIWFLVSLSCTFWKMYGGSQLATTLTSTFVPICTLIITARCLQPKLYKSTKEKAIGRFSADAVV